MKITRKYKTKLTIFSGIHHETTLFFNNYALARVVAEALHQDNPKVSVMVQKVRGSQKTGSK